MIHTYFCNPETSKEIISKIENNLEYEASIFEDRLNIEFELGHDPINVHIHYIMLEEHIGDPTYIQFGFGWYNLTIYGYFERPLLVDVAKGVGLKDEFISEISKINSPSCPLEIIDTVDHEKEKALSEMIGVNEGNEDDW